MATLNPYEEARLYNTASEREQWENLATLFSIIVTLDYLELAYVRGGVSEAAYTPACTRLLAQYKTALKLVTQPLLAGPSSSSTGVGSANFLAGGSKPPPVQGLDEFMRMYNMDMPAAHHRLLVGVPATVEHGAASSSSPSGLNSAGMSSASQPNGGAHFTANNGGSISNGGQGGSGSGSGGGGSSRERAKQVAETTQAFITFLDALKLKLRAKDSLHPLLSELVVCYTRCGEGTGGMNEEARAKMLHWLIQLNQMRASDEIDEEQARQLLFEIEGAYQEWFRSLQDS
ncbi:Vacuolar protein-sorting-associated protein 28 [Tilletia horrida]|uniref:Vacuolar protein-sorting-associated protein 28 n=1 Tax=Tilletia horrida TaxID=155126 RepID=A0AAN6GZ23_9BASI|nr:Vacuolar protein-sorting-associated protein 28 [Tilletia horrida]KAK0556140.1 Vacuolar protein-sorting-associated protein 28 [Tilletia horrida]KAK0569066.1 Vacuolar protein-sorting-associated protein 28 [Tilletia horrida]